jgi:hypothetical protein
MSVFLSRLLGGAGLSLLFSFAVASVPEHRTVQTLEAEQSEIFPEPETPPTDLRFGYDVAVRGTIALVGMPDASDSGRVAVFSRNSAGVWDRAATLSPSDARPDLMFGSHIAFKDNIAVIGAEDSAYVFKRAVNGTWTQTQKLTPAVLTPQTDFPTSLAYHQGMVVAGASTHNAPGVVYIFRLGSAGKLVSRNQITASDGFADDGFGAGVDLTQDTVVVGAPQSFHETPHPGAAYVFKRNADRWIERQKLVGSDVGAGEGFGREVAIDRGMIVVGAPDEGSVDNNGGPQERTGAAYVFVLSNGVWAEQQKLKADEAEAASTWFGEAIAMFNDRIVVGAHRSFHNGYFGPALGFTYARAGNVVTPLGVAVGDSGFESLSLSSYTLLMGSPYGMSCGDFACVGSASIHDVRTPR